MDLPGNQTSGTVPSVSAPPRFGVSWRPQIFSHVVKDEGHIERLNAEGGIAVDFARCRGSPVHLAFDGGQSTALSIWKTSSQHGFRSSPKFPSDLFTLRFVGRGSMIRNNIRTESVISRRDYATFVEFDDMSDGLASAGFSAISATLSRGTIVEATQALDGRDARPVPRFAPFVEIKTAGLRALQHALVALHGRVRAGPHELELLAPMLEELLVYQLIGAWPTLDDRLPSPEEMPNRALARAIDYIEANLQRRIALAEVAAVACVGVRALQLAFKRERGCTPIQYIIDRRLDHVRTALASSESTSVRQIASRWGFVHMSDFSRRYRERFGCSPSRSRTASCSDDVIAIDGPAS